MDFTLSLSSDWFNLLSLPLIFLTLKDVIPKWKSIWDNNLRSEDRRLLMRMVIFLALPVVVFIHEMGHLLAALSIGARVYEFHYGPVAGHVTVDSNLAPDKLLWIAVAGNLAQVMVGLVALALAAIVRSAPAIVFLVYLGLFSIGDTVIFYAALSLASIYGDWINIYQSPCTGLVFDVGVVHAVLVIFVLYCINGKAPRLWFTRKTMPEWGATHEHLAEEARVKPSAASLIPLVNSFMQAGLFKEADQCVRQAESLDAANPGTAYARAELEMARGNTDRAMAIFEKLACDEGLTGEMRAQIVVQMGELWLYRRNADKALQCFEAATNLDQMLGDAHLQKAILKANMNQYDSLEEDLAVLKSSTTHWLYRRNQETALKEIEKLESRSARHRQEGKA